jgi:hypothetical protein
VSGHLATRRSDANCKKLEQIARQAVDSLNIESEIIKVTDMKDIMAYDVLQAPRLVINEKLVSSGRIPTISASAAAEHTRSPMGFALDIRFKLALRARGQRSRRSPESAPTASDRVRCWHRNYVKQLCRNLHSMHW